MTETEKGFKTVTVAATGWKFDPVLFDKVIALRDRLYTDPDEVEPRTAIETRLSGLNMKNDPVKLRIDALVDETGEPKAFTIIETYLKDGKDSSGCITYGAADKKFAHSPGAIEHMIALHKYAVDGRDYPIISETNIGDPEIIAAATNKHRHPFSLDNNDDPLVTEMVLKLGVDPETIPQKLIKALVRINNGWKPSDREMRELIELGQLKDKNGNVTTAVVPSIYNAMNLDPEHPNADPANPFKGGPVNVTLSIPNVSKGVSYKGAATSYLDLNSSIASGNLEIPFTEAGRIVQGQQEYHETHGEIMRAHRIHSQEKDRGERVGERGGAALY